MFYTFIYKTNFIKNKICSPIRAIVFCCVIHQKYNKVIIPKKMNNWKIPKIQPNEFEKLKNKKIQ
jgi:hypothetical protein